MKWFNILETILFLGSMSFFREFINSELINSFWFSNNFLEDISGFGSLLTAALKTGEYSKGIIVFMDDNNTVWAGTTVAADGESWPFITDSWVNWGGCNVYYICNFDCTAVDTRHVRLNKGRCVPTKQMGKIQTQT